MDTESPKGRLAYLDNLRSFVIILVIAVHSSVTYSGSGSWYYKEGSWENLNILETSFFGIFQSFTQAWFMGILFFISAALSVKSIAKRGPVKFVQERLFRLGLPLLGYIFIITPFIHAALLRDIPEGSWLASYKNYLVSFSWLGSTGPLWFAEALLFFSVIYAGVKNFFAVPKRLNPFKLKSIIVIILLTGGAAFLLRLKFPIGSDVLNLQFSFFASYAVLFVLGVIAGENNLFERIGEEKNINWFKLALFAGIPAWSVIMITGGALKGEMYFFGGFNWQSFAYAMWESFTAIGFSMGITAFFKKYIDRGNKFTRFLAENAFGLYVFHTPWLIAVSLLLKNWKINLMVKFMLAALLTFIVCLGFSALIRKIKPLGMLLK
jgi:peptidoglycan/LPS O-acetylase OafA/YrhL